MLSDVQRDSLIPTDFVDHGWQRNPGFVASESIKDEIKRLLFGSQGWIFSSPNWRVDPTRGAKIDLDSFFPTLPQLLIRTFVLELHIAKISGLLKNAASSKQFEEYFDLCSTEAYKRYFYSKYSEFHRFSDIYALHISRCVETATQSFRDAIQPDDVEQILAISAVGDMHPSGHQTLKIQTSRRTLFAKNRTTSVGLLFDQLAVDLFHSKNIDYKNFNCAVDEKHQLLWQEDASLALKDDQEAPLDLYQTGLLLALAHYTNTSDLHMENIISTSSGPVAIDTECSFMPERVLLSDDLESSFAPLSLKVDRLGILPMPQVSTNEISFDFCYLNPLIPEDELSEVKSHIKNDGTSDITVVAPTADPETEAASTGTMPVSSPQIFTEYEIKALIRGFQDGASWIFENRNRIIDLATSKHYKTRIVPRPTQFYSDVLRLASSHPLHWMDSQERKNRIQELLSLHVGMPNRIAEVDLAALEDWFIPIHEVPIAMQESSDGNLSFKQSGLDTVVELISTIEQGDVIRQLRFIWQRLGWHMLPTGLRPDERQSTALGASLHDEVIHEVQKTVSRVINSTVDTHGRLAHQDFVNLYGTGMRTETGGSDLYGGSAGVLLAVSEATKLNIIRDQATYKRSQELAKLVHIQFSGQLTKKARWGFFDGTVGTAFSLASACKANLLSGVNHIFTDQKNQDLILDHVRTTSSFDIISGVSGIKLSIENIANDGVLPVPQSFLSALRKAALDRTIELQDSTGRWLDPETGHALFGVSHGSHGLLWSISDHGTDLFDIESGRQHKLFSKDSNNWPDPRLEDDRVFMDSWCHGPEGILLSRLDSLTGKVSAEQVSSLVHPHFDIRRWLNSIPKDSDLSLCHGQAGRLVTLSKLKSVLSEEGLTHLSSLIDTQANLITSNLLAALRAAHTPGANIFSVNNGLMLGSSGLLIALMSYIDNRCAKPLQLAL